MRGFCNDNRYRSKFFVSSAPALTQPPDFDGFRETIAQRLRSLAMDLLADIELRSLLAECRAHLVARTPAQLRALESLARKTGFRSAVHGSMPSLHGERSVTFYFFHFQIGEPALGEMMTAIRTSAEATIRFAPVIILIGDSYMSDVVRYVGQGFDDIVTLPEKAATLERRFAAQINTTITYYETGSYFGPDRRRLRRPEQLEPGQGTYRHRRYVIRRVPSSGVHLLSRELVTTGSGPAVQSQFATGDSVHFE
jgi:hypothetical protein